MVLTHWTEKVTLKDLKALYRKLMENVNNNEVQKKSLKNKDMYNFLHARINGIHLIISYDLDTIITVGGTRYVGEIVSCFGVLLQTPLDTPFFLLLMLYLNWKYVAKPGGLSVCLLLS